MQQVCTGRFLKTLKEEETEAQQEGKRGETPMLVQENSLGVQQLYDTQQNKIHTDLSGLLDLISQQTWTGMRLICFTLTTQWKVSCISTAVLNWRKW